MTMKESTILNETQKEIVKEVIEIQVSILWHGVTNYKRKRIESRLKKLGFDIDSSQYEALYKI